MIGRESPQSLTKSRYNEIMPYVSPRFQRNLRVAGLSLLTFLSTRQVQAQAFDDAAAIMERIKDTVASISDYSCVFSKHELIGNRICREDNIILKVKRPGHFYMKWTKGPNKDRVAIYVEGRNDNKITVHLKGLFGFFTVAIDPKGKKALKENRHSITELDLAGIFDRFIADCRKGRADPECNSVVSAPKDPDTLELKAVFPPGKGYYTHIATLTVDRCSWLPMRLACYGWNNEFLEEYCFDDIKINLGLTGKDFEKDW